MSYRIDLPQLGQVLNGEPGIICTSCWLLPGCLMLPAVEMAPVANAR